MGAAHFFVEGEIRTRPAPGQGVVEVKNELLIAVTQLAAERNLPHRIVVSAVEAALASAYKRDPAAEGQDVEVRIDAESGDVEVYTIRHVVEPEDIEEPGMQVTAEEAQALQPGARVGDIIRTGQLEYKPGRIAAQTAKQVVMQRLREAERDLVFDEFVDREGEVLTATIQRVESRYITVDLGRAEAIMPPTEQSPFERYRPGQQLKFFVARVERTQRGPEIVVSRTHPDLLRRLFEVEVPEIFNGVVEIKAIAREPGSRSKVGVASNQQGVDAVGACVGLRGIRIQNVVNELLGEKIDVIEWDDDPAQFIANSLSPAVVDRVILDEDGHTAVVIVPDRQLSLAIGREGQNARLAAKLTNWRIDIQGASELAEKEAVAAPEAAEALTPPDRAAKEPIRAEAIAATERQVSGEPEIVPAQAPQRAPAPVAKAAADAVAADSAADGAAREQAELLALEEELAVLEREEADRKAAEEQRREAEVLDVSSDDLWQVDTGEKEPAEAGAIRFAEDIAGFRDRDEGSRRRGGNRGGGRRGGGRR